MLKNKAFSEFEDKYGQILFCGSGYASSVGITDAPIRARVNGVFYLDEDDAIRFHCCGDESEFLQFFYSDERERINEKAADFFSGILGVNFHNNNYTFILWRFLGDSIGRRIYELDDIVQARKDRIAKRHVKESPDVWKALYARFGGRVIGLAKEIDAHETGFNVRLLLRHDPFEERRAFVRMNAQDLLAFVTEEIKRQKFFMRKIGDLSFYYPQEMVILSSAAEVEIQFSVKGSAPDAP